MEPWIVVVGLAAVALAVDRALTWAERRGWVYWRHERASRSAVGSAMLELHALLERDKEHVVEERARQRGDIEQAGDDDPLDREGARGWDDPARP